MINRLRFFLVCCLVTMTVSAVGQDTAFLYTYGGEGYDECRGIVTTSDTGYLLAGSTGSFGAGNSDVYLVKLDSNYQLEWSSTWGGANTEQGQGVDNTNDGGYIVTGFVNDLFGGQGYDLLLVRFDDQGQEVWNKRYGGQDWDFGYSVLALDDGGFVVAGETYSFGSGSTDAWILRTDSQGDTLWSHLTGSTQQDVYHRLAALPDGNFIAVGGTTLPGETESDVLLTKFSTDGQVIWQRTWDFGGHDVARDIDITPDSGLVLTGHYTGITPEGDENPFIFRADSTGDSIFVRPHYNSINSENRDDRGNVVYNLPNNRYVIGGVARTFGDIAGDFFAMGLTPSGFFTSNNTTQGGGGLDEAFDGLLSWQGDEIMAGVTNGHGQGFSDMMIIVYRELNQDPTPFVVPTRDSLPLNVSVEEHQSKGTSPQYNLYPNPATEQVVLEMEPIQHTRTLTLFDQLGRRVLSQKLASGAPTTSFSVAGLPTGIYAFQVMEQGQLVITGKLAIE